MEQIILSDIETALVEIPVKLETSDIGLSQTRFAIAEMNESLDIAKTNAMLNAPDGRNESERKLNREKWIATDKQCQILRQHLSALQSTASEQEADNAKMRRQFAAYCHIAELRAAQLNLQAKGDNSHV